MPPSTTYTFYYHAEDAKKGVNTVRLRDGTVIKYTLMLGNNDDKHRDPGKVVKSNVRSESLYHAKHTRS